MNLAEFLKAQPDAACKTYAIALAKALFDLAEGDGWEDIYHRTGLPEDRCKEIKQLVEEFYIWRNNGYHQ